MIQSRSSRVLPRSRRHVMAWFVPAIHVFVRPQATLAEPYARNMSGYQKSGRAIKTAQPTPNHANLQFRTVAATLRLNGGSRHEMDLEALLYSPASRQNIGKREEG